jgi:hypothetical protein
MSDTPVESVRQRLRRSSMAQALGADERAIVARVRDHSRLDFLADHTVAGFVLESMTEDPDIAAAYANRGLDTAAWEAEELQLGNELMELIAAVAAQAQPRADYGGRTAAQVLAMNDGESQDFHEEMATKHDAAPRSMFIPKRATVEKPKAVKHELDSDEDIANDVADVGKVIIFNRRTVPPSEELDALIRSELRGLVLTTPAAKAAHAERGEKPAAWAEVLRLAGHAISGVLAAFARIEPKLKHIRDDLTGRDLEDMTDAEMQRYGKDWTAADAAARRRWS